MTYDNLEALCAEQYAVNCRFDELAEKKRELDMAIAACKDSLKHLNKAIYATMMEVGVKSDHAGIYTVFWRDGADSIVVDEEGLPDEYARTKREPDKTKIKQALQTGALLNFAILQQGEPIVTVKLRGK